MQCARARRADKKHYMLCACGSVEREKVVSFTNYETNKSNFNRPCTQTRKPRALCSRFVELKSFITVFLWMNYTVYVHV